MTAHLAVRFGAKDLLQSVESLGYVYEVYGSTLSRPLGLNPQFTILAGAEMNALIAVWLKDDFFAFYVLPPVLLVIILFVVWAVCKILHQIYGYRIVVPNAPALEEKFWKGNPEEKVVRPPTAEEIRQANMRNAWNVAHAQEQANRLAKENARREKEKKEAAAAYKWTAADWALVLIGLTMPAGLIYHHIWLLGAIYLLYYFGQKSSRNS